MPPLGAQLEFVVPPRAIAGGHDAWLIATWVLNMRSGFRGNFFQQLRDKIKKGELRVGDAVFRAAQDVRVYNGLLDTMEQDLRLPALGTMTCGVFSQIKVRQVRAAHRFVVIFADGRAGELLFAILLAALLLLIPLARVEHRWPAVQHVNRLVVHPCS